MVRTMKSSKEALRRNKNQIQTEDMLQDHSRMMMSSSSSEDETPKVLIPRGQCSSSERDSDDDCQEIPPGQEVQLRKTVTVMIPEGQKLSEDPLLPSQEIVVEHQEPQAGCSNSNKSMLLIDLIELIWSSMFLKVIIEVLVKVERIYVKERNLEMKRQVIIIQKLMLSVLKKAKANSIELKRFSFKAFVNLCQKDELYTKYMKKPLPNILVEKIIQTYEKSIEEPCSSSVTTKNITTSSTIVPTIITPAVVQSLNDGRQEKVLGEDFLDELLPVSSTPLNIGSISQSIARGTQDKFVQWTSPGETAFHVIKLDVYNFSKIVKLEKKNWWKEAEVRTTFLTSSPLDPNYIAIQKILKNAAKQIVNIEGTKKTEKPKNYYFGSKNTQ
ncbi:PREDICTED: uncharacterized protein LOC108379953 [Rhagoletis zephyria]|uniref:uncharacterized protein LOC108379953 n=1 Tax=Rhagoletis zephyria TaxID=28612 RepID=UPI0008117E93|nr:PREDICTED: uncharacterized protein LOC108379953 [Rhagoletis zephyria]